MSEREMRAVRFHRFGPAQELVIERIPPPPSPAAGQLLVRVHAAGVNPFDVGLRAGLLQNRIPITLPAIPGVELSGTIEAVGAEVTGFSVGQAVYANKMGAFNNGTSAEYVLVPAEMAAPMPHNLNFLEAASVTHGARTAWSGLFEYGDLQPGQRVLVQGGAGGVGLYVIQLARHLGAHVIATTSQANLDFVRRLGADEVIDYNATPFETVVKEVDLVYDTVGGEVMERSWQTLKPGGLLVSAVGFPSPETAAQRGVRCARVMAPKDLPAILARVTALVEAGELTPYLRHVFPMEQAAAAHVLCESRHGRGRIVLQIAD